VWSAAKGSHWGEIASGEAARETFGVPAGTETGERVEQEKKGRMTKKARTGRREGKIPLVN
jgi:hypothetical protein